MSFADRAAAHRKTKELKSEIKQLKKEMLACGCEKAVVNTGVRDLLESIEQGGVLYAEYKLARMHLEKAQGAMEPLLASLGEASASGITEQLKELVSDLEQCCHDCLIRRDDVDFQSTVSCLRKMTAENVHAKGGNAKTGMSAIMLRSELENIKAVLDDMADRSAPDFFALGYFFLHADKNSLKDMENEQRNAHVMSYCREHFWDAFAVESERAGCGTCVQELIQKYIYE